MSKHAFLWWLRFAILGGVPLIAALVAGAAIFHWGEINWPSLAEYSLLSIGTGGALGNLAFRAKLEVPAFSRLGAASWLLTLAWGAGWIFAASASDSSHEEIHTLSSQVAFSLALSFFFSLVALMPLKWLVSDRTDLHRQP